MVATGKGISYPQNLCPLDPADVQVFSLTSSYDCFVLTFISAALKLLVVFLKGMVIVAAKHTTGVMVLKAGTGPVCKNPFNSNQNRSADECIAVSLSRK